MPLNGDAKRDNFAHNKGEGGILPAGKNRPEIDKICDVEPHADIILSPGHSAFNVPLEFVTFIETLRQHSNGKPVGFKVCVGRQSEFFAIRKARVETGIPPDFITVDSGEGGTRASPPEYSNSVGMPLRGSLAFVVDVLVGHNRTDDTRIIASGNIIKDYAWHGARARSTHDQQRTGFHAVLRLHLALKCNRNTCPTGITTPISRLVSSHLTRPIDSAAFTTRRYALWPTCSQHRGTRIQMTSSETISTNVRARTGSFATTRSTHPSS